MVYTLATNGSEIDTLGLGRPRYILLCSRGATASDSFMQLGQPPKLSASVTEIRRFR